MATEEQKQLEETLGCAEATRGDAQRRTSAAIATTERRDTSTEGARTQSFFREINDRIEAFVLDSRAEQPQLQVLCECASRECVEHVALTEGEYESVRRVPTHFLVLPGHDVPEIERVVEETDRYVVVEKFGEGGTVAVQLDSRRGG